MLSTLRTSLRASPNVRTMATGKDIKFGVDGRAAMLKGEACATEAFVLIIRYMYDHRV